MAHEERCERNRAKKAQKWRVKLTRRVRKAHQQEAAALKAYQERKVFFMAALRQYLKLSRGLVVTDHFKGYLLSRPGMEDEAAAAEFVSTLSNFLSITNAGGKSGLDWVGFRQFLDCQERWGKRRALLSAR